VRAVLALGEARDAAEALAPRGYGGTRALSQVDPLARYISQAEPLHDLLRRGLIQLSGFLLKRTIAGPRAIVDYEPVEGAVGGS
jgi:hypothetical protein